MNVKTMSDVWSRLRPGDIILFQHMEKYETDGKSHSKLSKPILGIIIGVDLWDMASVVYYVNTSQFLGYLKRNNSMSHPEVHYVEDWSDEMYVLGRWRFYPSLSELKRALRLKMSTE